MASAWSSSEAAERRARFAEARSSSEKTGSAPMRSRRALTVRARRMTRTTSTIKRR